MINIGHRYTSEHIVRRTGRYEEVNPFVDGFSFAIQSALIGAPLEMRHRKDQRDLFVSVVALIIFLSSVALWSL